MTKPVEATPELEGEEIVRFFKWMEDNEKNPVKLKPVDVIYDDEFLEFHKRICRERMKLVEHLKDETPLIKQNVSPQQVLDIVIQWAKNNLKSYKNSKNQHDQGQQDCLMSLLSLIDLSQKGIITEAAVNDSEYVKIIGLEQKVE